jgi:hypothetical protein
VALTAWRAGNGLWGLLLLAGASVQLNDPDPAAWIAAYCVAALFCAASLMRRLTWRPPACWGIAMLCWAGVVAAGGIQDSNPMRGPGGLFQTGPLAEEIVRECLGLTLIAIGCFVQARVLYNHAASVSSER